LTDKIKICHRSS